MNCAILGNGPSRLLYDPTVEYDYRIGCNIPWTKVDSTVIMDREVITLWSKNLELITCPVWLTRESYQQTHSSRIGPEKIRMREYLTSNNLFLGIEKQPEHYSSGHVAALKAIGLGYTNLDLYGFDSIFSNSVESYSRTHVNNVPGNLLIDDKRSNRWRKAWDKLIASYTDVNFIFVKET